MQRKCFPKEVYMNDDDDSFLYELFECYSICMLVHYLIKTNRVKRLLSLFLPIRIINIKTTFVYFTYILELSYSFRV
jgi:hypothetical protein